MSYKETIVNEFGNNIILKFIKNVLNLGCFPSLLYKIIY